jgi:hypothetical protein
MPVPLVALVLLGLVSGEGQDLSQRHPARSTGLPLPRDGDAAVREELDAARRAGTVQAYDLFIARHGGHPLARVARRERASLTQEPPKPRGQAGT